jgi:hypothetical protein
MLLLNCGKNTIAATAPVHGFGIGPTKAKAKTVAMNMAHVFANAAAATRTAKWKCPTVECPQRVGPIVAHEKTTELVTINLQDNLYLSVVRRTFDIVIFCK